MPLTPIIRPVQPSDEPALGRIAYQTGFFGQSAERFFPHEHLFSLLWIHPYFNDRHPCGFVAQSGGQVMGYIIGAANQRAYQLMLAQALALGLWRHLRPPARLPGCLPYLLRAARHAPPHADWRTYPAHLHINLRPEARGLRLGEQLLQAYLQRLEDLGVPGVQLSTTTENRAALGLYRKFGFEIRISKVTPLWTPWLGHPAQHVIMGKRLESAARAED